MFPPSRKPQFFPPQMQNPSDNLSFIGSLLLHDSLQSQTLANYFSLKPPISVFGVSAESMQCSYDPKGNSVPTILLLMQERLYTQGGLKAEGIFRINPENSQEEHVRDQLNRGIVPKDIDVHCLAGLIKAWFRELPEGILDGLSPEQVLQCNTEEECVELVKELLPIQAALLSWAVDLMADVVEEEELNKMNARNIAMVFAPSMTQMSDPLTALMHAVGKNFSLGDFLCKFFMFISWCFFSRSVSIIRFSFP
ncbi:Rho GTPase-activating protein 2 [Ranunculus cassubicifolius]